MIQRSKQRYSNMLWNMRSITRHKRSYGHPLQPDLTPDVLTCVLPLGTVSSGRESEVESAHLFLTIIQFFSACHLTSQHTSTCIHNSIISHSPTHYKSPVHWLIQPSTNTQTHINALYSGIKMVFLSNERRTIMAMTLEGCSVSYKLLFHFNKLVNVLLVTD